MSVFIMIDEVDCRKVVDARDYQQIALNNYINNGFQNTIVEYGTDTEVCFSIGMFDKKGLSGEYDDVYSYIREDGSELLISRNHDKLSGLCGFLNRVTEYMPNTSDSV